MDKALVDSSTLFDIQRSVKNPTSTWANTTLGNLLAYRQHYQKLTISGVTLFELLEGLYRGGDKQAITDFHKNLMPRYEVIHPDAHIEEMAAEIHATLRLARQSIDVPDTFIAATAIVHDLTLVNANTRHFARVAAAGFPLKLENWREV